MKRGDGKKRVDVKIALLGKQSVGKTALVNRYKDDYFTVTTESTIGAAFCIKEKLSRDGSTIIRASIWDTAGMERYKSIVPMYIRDAATVFICFDRPDLKEIDENIVFVRKINEECRIVLVRTKTDMAPTFDVDYNKAVDAQLVEYAANKGYKIYKTSSKLGTGVTELFEENIEISYILTLGMLTQFRTTPVDPPVTPPIPTGKVYAYGASAANMCCTMM